MSIGAFILAGYRTALGQAGVNVELRYRTFAAENPMSAAEQYTTAIEDARGLLANSPIRNLSERFDGATNKIRLTVAKEAVSARPNKGTVVVDGADTYIVTDIQEVQGVLYICDLAGPSLAGTVAADITPPRFTATGAAGGEAAFSYTATSNESVYHRIRYRISGGAWVTQSYNGTLQTSISGSGPSLDAGLYTVAIQGKDAAGNESAWTDCGTVTISGVPS